MSSTNIGMLTRGEYYSFYVLKQYRGMPYKGYSAAKLRRTLTGRNTAAVSLLGRPMGDRCGEGTAAR
jgi:hypothetical protein